MKSIFLLLSLLWLGTSFSQENIHFLLSSSSSVRITDPMCKTMSNESISNIVSQIDRMNRNQKKERIKSNQLDLPQQSFFEFLQRIKAEPDRLLPAFPLTQILSSSYKFNQDRNIYCSAQKVSVKHIGPAQIEISIKNMQVSSSETAMDMSVKNLMNTSTTSQNIHFSCPTGRLLLDELEYSELPWIYFWQKFYDEVNAQDWLEQAILNVEPSLVSKGIQDKRSEEKISQLGLTSKENLIKGTANAKHILKALPYYIPFDEIVATLISQDEQKLCLLTCHQYPDLNDEDEYFEDFESDHHEMTEWNFEKIDGQWHIHYSEDYNSDSLEKIRTFYMSGFDAENRFNEENWIEKFHFKNLVEYSTSIVLVHEVAPLETERLIQTEIQPTLNQLFNEKGKDYNGFYQRISSLSNNWWGEQEDEKIITQDVLISNPEKTAFIFPVLLTVNKKENEAFTSSNEVFKFYVLLKNPDASYTLYDWHYFKPFPYWTNFALLRCAERHLGHISNYTSDQKIISDPSFWDNYIFKSTARGYDYLSEVTTENESMHITKSEFDATVQECIFLLTEHDVVDLYEHQLKMITRCLNTIEREKLSGINNQRFVTLCQELYFQKRLNRIQTAEGNFYPSLDLELGAPMKPHSYYHIH